MTSEDRNRADARFNKAARAASEAKTVKSDRDVASKAVLDNMAKLKALRLAREAAAPPAAPKKARGKSSAVKSSGKKTAEKGPALGDWLGGAESREGGG